MNNPVRILAVVLALLLLFLLALLFPGFFLDNLVSPIATVLLLFWRIIQSVDGAVYWVLLVLIITGYLSMRIIGAYQAAPELGPAPSLDSNAIFERIVYWRLSIKAAHLEKRYRSLKHELGMMLAALYASRELEAVQFEMYDAMKRGEISLPEPVYAYLFPPEPSNTPLSLKGMFARIRDLYDRQVRQWTGREAAQEDKSIEQVLAFMESLLETGHDDPN